MRTTAIRASFMAIAAIGVALLVAAIAVAQPGDGEGESATPTGEPVTSSPGAIPENAATETAAPSDTVSATDGPTENANDAPPTDAGAETGSVPGTTPALNPGGHCVVLPNDSDIVRNPDKHPNWTVGACVPDEVEPGNGDSGEDNDPPERRTPSLNPDGVCVNLPNNSDIVRNPQKHPEWVVGGCELPVE
jgi:hypothetical protein